MLINHKKPSLHQGISRWSPSIILRYYLFSGTNSYRVHCLSRPYYADTIKIARAYCYIIWPSRHTAIVWTKRYIHFLIPLLQVLLVLLTSADIKKHNYVFILPLPIALSLFRYPTGLLFFVSQSQWNSISSVRVLLRILTISTSSRGVRTSKHSRDP